MAFIAFILFGLIVGFIARAIVPGEQRMGLLATSLLGIAGSLIGGVLGNAIFGGNWSEPVAAGWIGSIGASILLLILFGAMGRRTARV